MPLFGRRRAPEPDPVRPGWPPLPEPPAVRPDGLRTMEDHRDYLLSCVEELPPFRVGILDTYDLTLCEDVVATVNLPGFDNSAMDGYAVRAQDVAGATVHTPVRLPVVGKVAAGGVAEHRLAPGTATKIMTGAPTPPGADAIVPYENTDRGAEEVVVHAASRPGQHIRRRGEDVQAGTQVLIAGRRLTEREIGLLAAVGRDTALVRPRPRVAVVSTGSELVPPGTALAAEHQIYDSNSYLLAAAARGAGAEVFRVGQVGDDADALRQLIADQLVRADLVVTTGGVSQGDYDLVKAVVPELGATDFVGVAMQPGKPQGFGLLGNDQVPIVMLPGNPVSAFVSFQAFVRPLIRKLGGVQPYLRPTVACRASRRLDSIPGRLQLARGRVSRGPDGVLDVDVVGGHGSHLIGGLSDADALVHLPAETTWVEKGEELDVWLLDDRAER